MNSIFKILLVGAPATGLLLWLLLTQQEQHREIMRHDKQEFKQQVQKFDADFADAWASKPIKKPEPITANSPAGESQETELRAARQQLSTELNQRDKDVSLKDVLGVIE
jgi:hypothetical protein